MSIDDVIQDMKNLAEIYRNRADRFLDSLRSAPDLYDQEAYSGYACRVKEYEKVIEWLEELKCRRTMMLQGGYFENEIRRKTVTEFVEKLHEELSAKSERLHFDGHTVDMLTLDNALDAVDVAAERMVEDE